MSAGTYSQSAPRQSPTLLHYGNSTRAFDKLMLQMTDRTAYFIAKQRRRGRRYGWALFKASPNRLGLYNLNGIVAAPRPNRPWRAPVERRR
jgi:hypothetical protein